MSVRQRLDDFILHKIWVIGKQNSLYLFLQTCVNIYLKSYYMIYLFIQLLFES